MKDEVLADVIKMCVRGPRSPCILIQNSHELQKWFADFCKADGASGRIGETRNMRAAKHRFESFSMPLNRMVRHFVSVVRLAIKVAHERTDKFGDACAEFLAWISNKRALLLGMLADAGDESLCLTRFFDNEQMDVAELNAEVDSYIGRIKALFGENPVCFDTTSFTKIMLQRLQTPRVWVMRGRHCSLGRDGGLTPDEKHECLCRLRCWLKLCCETLKAEFPDFELARVRCDRRKTLI